MCSCSLQIRLLHIAALFASSPFHLIIPVGCLLPLLEMQLSTRRTLYVTPKCTKIYCQFLKTTLATKTTSYDKVKVDLWYTVSSLSFISPSFQNLDHAGHLLSVKTYEAFKSHHRYTCDRYTSTGNTGTKGTLHRHMRDMKEPSLFLY